MHLFKLKGVATVERMPVIWESVKKWGWRWFNLSTVIDLGLLLRYGWGDFIREEYWRGYFVALTIMPAWMLLARVADRVKQAPQQPGSPHQIKQ